MNDQVNKLNINEWSSEQIQHRIRPKLQILQITSKILRKILKTFATVFS